MEGGDESRMRRNNHHHQHHQHPVLRIREEESHLRQDMMMGEGVRSMWRSHMDAALVHLRSHVDAILYSHQSRPMLPSSPLGNNNKYTPSWGLCSATSTSTS
ncbi:hypothetical protein AAC387_Pa11g2262 [Persea americana]